MDDDDEQSSSAAATSPRNEGEIERPTSINQVQSNSTSASVTGTPSPQPQPRWDFFTSLMYFYLNQGLLIDCAD